MSIITKQEKEEFAKLSNIIDAEKLKIAIDETVAKWITREAYPGTHYPFYDSRCSKCGFKTAIVFKEWENKCPRCKSEMREGKDGVYGENDQARR